MSGALMDATDVPLSQVTPSSAVTQKLRIRTLQIKFIEILQLRYIIYTHTTMFTSQLTCDWR